MAIPKIEQAKDCTRRWKVSLRHETNAELEYDGSEDLSAKLWSGDDTAPLATPSVEWISAPNEVRVIIEADDLEDIDPGIYRLRVYVGDESTHAAEASIKILSAPGSSEALKTYCSAEDLRRLWSKIEELQDRDEDRAGFEEQRFLARKWLDELIQMGYSNGSYCSVLGYGYFPRGLYARDQLQMWLDNDGLIVSQGVINACAYYALYLICDSQITADTESKMNYQKLADRFRKRATQIVYSSGFEIDTNEDGNGDFLIELNGVKAILG